MRRVLCLADVDVVAREDDHARDVFVCVAAVVMDMRAKSWMRALASRSVVVVFCVVLTEKASSSSSSARAERTGRVRVVWGVVVCVADILCYITN